MLVLVPPNCVLGFSVVPGSRKKKRPAKKAKSKDDDEASGSDDDGHDQNSVEKVTLTVCLL